MLAGMADAGAELGVWEPPGADREDEFLAVKTWGLLWPRLVLTTELSSDLGHCSVGKRHIPSGLALKWMRLKI